MLNEINRRTILENNFEIVKWNMNKKYLYELEEKGVTIVKSLWYDEFDKKKIVGSFEELDTEQIIIKPLVSASAFNTFWLDKNENNHSPFSASMKKLEKVFSNRSFVIQPFVKNIITEGEYSLFYFNNEFSHCIKKTPKQNDFRVQEEYGGILKLVEPAESMKKISEEILSILTYDLLYARIDLVRYEDEFALMELELIEPSLNFQLSPDSAEKFVNAFVRKIWT